MVSALADRDGQDMSAVPGIVSLVCATLIRR
jgi:hypothetical protein